MENLNAIFSNTAREYAHNTAILYFKDEYTQETITYKQLQNESATIAKLLFEDLGDSKEVPAVFVKNADDIKSNAKDAHSQVSSNDESYKSTIAIFGQPGPSTIACILGALARNAYFYISPDCTEPELKTNLDRVKPQYMLVEEDVFHNYNLDISLVVNNCVVFGNTFKLLSFITSQNNIPKSINKDLAFVITTSGSTGTPKHVYVPHKCIIPNITDFVKIFKIRTTDCIFCASPLTFDPSVVDMFMAFKRGAKLVMVQPHVLKMPKLLLDIMRKSKTTILQATPSLVTSLKKGLKEMFDIRVLAMGGELFPKLSILRYWLGNNCKMRVFNVYGITEVSCWATIREVNLFSSNEIQHTKNNVEVNTTINDIIPIGEPLSCTVVRVLNENHKVLAEGQEGEIFIGGKERMCWIDSDILPTSDNVSPENLCINFSDTEKSKLVLRSTGDRGVLINGNTYCLGRLDSVVKRNGQKVSLYEITRACETLAYVEKCIVIEDKKRISAFVSLQNENVVSRDTLRKDLKDLLSSWKMPDDVIILQTIPFNKHGKVNKEMLLQEKCLKGSELENADSLGKLLEILWKTKLGISHVHYRDNFIKCGGDSLTAVQLLEELERYSACAVPELLDVILNKDFESILKLLTRYNVKCSFQNTEYPNKVKRRRSENGNEDQYGTTADSNSPENNTNKARTVTKEMCIVSKRGFYTCSSFCQNSLEPSSAELLWKFDLGKCIDSSPIVMEYSNEQTFVLVGSHSHRLICVDAIQGCVRWCIMLADRIESSPNSSQDGSYAYVGCYSGDLYCIEVAGGNIAWKYKTGDAIKSSPVVDESRGYIIVGSHDKNLYCVDNGGSLVWKNKISKGSIFSSPCTYGNLVFAATLDGIIVGIDINTGNINWKDSVNNPIFSSPAVYSQGIVFSNVAGEIFGYSFSGSRLWSYKTGGNIFSSPFVSKLQNSNEAIAIGCHDKKVYILNGKGEKISICSGNSPVYSTPFLYSTPKNDLISVICETSGLVRFLKVNSHSPVTLLEFNLPGELFSSPVVYRNKAYICSRDNFIYCFELQ